MTRVVTALVLLLFAVAPAWGATTFFWRAEGTTLSGTDDLPGADTAASTTGTPAINGTAALIGSNGIQINAASESYNLDSESAVINIGAGTLAFYLRVQTFADLGGIVLLKTNSGDVNDRLRAYISTTTNNHLQFVSKTSGSGVSTTFDCTVALSTNTTYFVIYKWDQSVSDRRCEIYDSAGSHISGSPVEDLATGWTSPVTSYPVTDGMVFGEYLGAAPAYYLDNIFLATTWADADTIYCNRDITSFSSYAACGGAATVRSRMLLGVGQ